MLGHPLGSLPEGLLLLHDDSVLTLESHLSGLGIGHSKHVISVYSSVDTAVAWDGLSELLHLWLVVINSEEGILSLLNRLAGNLSFLGLQSGEILTLGLSSVLFFCNGFIGEICCIESMHLRWWDWLFEK